MDKQKQGEKWTLFAVLLVVVITGLTGAVFLDMQREQAAYNDEMIVGSVGETAVTLRMFQNEVGLQAARNQISGRENDVINQAELLNRLIGDILLLEGAEIAGIELKNQDLDNSIENFLTRNDLSREEFVKILEKNRTDWEGFEQSMHDYLVMTKFVNGVLLKGVDFSNQSTVIETWVSDRYQLAGITFDETFLAAVNSGSSGRFRSENDG